MKNKLPTVKKKITGFLLEEHGRISKQSMLSLGAILAGAAIGAELPAKIVDAQIATSHTHNHAASVIPKPKPAYSSYSSHNSHNSY